jgi:hypothetical protein
MCQIKEQRTGLLVSTAQVDKNAAMKGFCNKP